MNVNNKVPSDLANHVLLSHKLGHLLGGHPINRLLVHSNLTPLHLCEVCVICVQGDSCTHTKQYELSFAANM
jgi:hypothetical protein